VQCEIGELFRRIYGLAADNREHRLILINLILRDREK
jgi:hypothetical protein